MAKDMSDTVRSALTSAVREVSKNVGDTKPKRSSGGPLSGARGLAAGAGLAAAAPLAKKGFDAVRANGGLPTPSPTRAAGKMASKASDRVGANLKDAVSGKVDEAGGAGGLVKEAASGLLPGSGGGDGGKDGMPGVGKGRRMPVQQSVDVAVELETAYNQFTQFEDWPQFMHRVTNVSQDDDNSIHFTTKIWGKTKEYAAEIVTQRPDDRIKWKVSQGITHNGVASFHELAPRLTRIEVTLDVEPGSLIEKAARGMRHIKRAVRADLARFKAFMEMQEMETGAWRGVIEDGEVVEPHDDAYDEERDYSHVDDLYEEFGSQSDEDDDEKDEKSHEPIPVEELPRDRSGRFKKGAGARSPSGKTDGKTDAKSSSRSRTAAKRSTSSRSRAHPTAPARPRRSARRRARRAAAARAGADVGGDGQERGRLAAGRRQAVAGQGRRGVRRGRRRCGGGHLPGVAELGEPRWRRSLASRTPRTSSASRSPHSSRRSTTARSTRARTRG
jgi:uncharacterized membrane protein